MQAKESISVEKNFNGLWLALYVEMLEQWKTI